MFGLVFGALFAIDSRGNWKTGSYWLRFAIVACLYIGLLTLVNYIMMPAYVGPYGGMIIPALLFAVLLRLTLVQNLLSTLRDPNERSLFPKLNFIEVVVVVAIIAILGALLAPAIAAAQNAANRASGNVDVESSAGTAIFLLIFAAVVVMADFASLLLVTPISSGRRNESEAIDFPFQHFGKVTLLWVPLWLGAYVSSWEMFHPAAYRNLLGEVKQTSWEEGVETPSEDSIRAVNEEQASWKMKQALSGTIGSTFHPGKPFHQRDAQGRARWVAPLVYNSPGSVWFQKAIGGSVNFPSGYIVYSSENPDENPHLVDNLNEKPIQFRFSPNGWTGENLYRQVYNQPGMKSKHIRGYTFELDDENRPFYIFTICEPTISYYGDKAVGYTIVDPQTGDCKNYSVAELPKWVDCGMPADLIDERIEWWGKYPKSIGDGAWAHFFNTSGKDRVKASSDRPRLTWDHEQTPHLFSGITSRSSKDNSLVSFLLVNPRNGEATACPVDGQDENGTLTAVDNLVKYQHLHGSDPVLYNLFGHRCWVVPVSGESHTFMGMAVVDKDAKRPVFGKSKREALEGWRQYLAENHSDPAVSNKNTAEMVLGVVDVINVATQEGRSTAYIRLASQNSIFLVSAKGFDQAMVTKPGETVYMEYLTFPGQETRSVQLFRNETLFPTMPVKVGSN